MKTGENGIQGHHFDSNHERQNLLCPATARSWNSAIVHFISEVQLWCERTGVPNFKTYGSGAQKASDLGVVVSRSHIPAS